MQKSKYKMTIKIAQISYHKPVKQANNKPKHDSEGRRRGDERSRRWSGRVCLRGAIGERAIGF